MSKADVDRAERRFVSSLEQSSRRVALKIRKAHATVDMRDLDASWPTYTQAIGASGVAEEYEATTYEALMYLMEVLAASGQAPQNPPQPRRFNWPKIVSILRLTGPIYLKRLAHDGWPDQAALLKSLNRTIRHIQGDLNAEAQQTLLDVTSSANRDALTASETEIVQGVERVPEPTACAFCRMLAGASKKHPIFNVTPKWEEPHPGCKCSLRLLPVYRTRRVRSAAEIALGQQMYEAIKASRDRALATARAA